MNNRLYGNLIFELSKSGRKGYTLPANNYEHTVSELPAGLLRQQEAQLPECDELTVVRHYTNLSHNNFGVNDGFYPLGSCTMKYNPVINEELAAMQTFAGLHPLQPVETCQHALALYYHLQQMLAELTGLSEFTLNPCAGAHGELTGLMVIRAYHESRGDHQRLKVLIPDSAHGTNPASAAVCGLEVVEVKSKADGTVDVDDLRRLVEDCGDSIAAMMMTNPNTLGIFEYAIPEITKIVHDCGGLMYYDGANLNPMLGACRPGDMGFDVMHINLHKTFSTPHGGGGPGSGPVGVRQGLEQFLPAPRVVLCDDDCYAVSGFGTDDASGDMHSTACGSIGAFFGNFAVMIKAYVYILSLGRENVKMVGPLATLNANYVKESLKDVYELPISGLCKHEFVFDGLKDKSTGVTTMDVAKRLLDYGYHAPTIYFPLLFHESLMIEPTENESRETLDAFIAVMRQIAGEAATDPDMVKSAPHKTPIGRVDDVLAARRPVVTYRQMLALQPED
jgi:glycine dehydrogenase subunit 2